MREVLAILWAVAVTGFGISALSVQTSACEVVSVSEGTPVGSEIYLFDLPSYVSNVTVVSPEEGVLEGWGIRVDPHSGQVIAMGLLDREERAWIQIDAYITDYSSSHAEPQPVSVCLNITDENDCAPEWTMQPYPYLAAVAPDAPPGTPVYQLTAHDPDLYPNNVFLYYEIAGRSLHFHLDATNGTITTRGRPLVADQDYFITVMAQDTAGNQSPRANVSIRAGRRPPQFYQSKYEVDVDEDQPVGTIVVTVQAKSFADLPITYSFVGGASSVFSLNGSTGAITVARPLSYDVMPHTFNLNVIAIEGGIHGYASIMRVVIHLREVNESTVSPPTTTVFGTVVRETSGAVTDNDDEATALTIFSSTSYAVGTPWTTPLAPTGGTEAASTPNQGTVGVDVSSPTNQNSSATPITSSHRTLSPTFPVFTHDTVTTPDQGSVGVNVTSPTNDKNTSQSIPITSSHKTLDPTFPAFSQETTAEHNVSPTTAPLAVANDSTNTATRPFSSTTFTTFTEHSVSKPTNYSTEKPEDAKTSVATIPSQSPNKTDATFGCPAGVTVTDRTGVTEGRLIRVMFTLTWPETAPGKDAYSLETCDSGSQNAGRPHGRRRCHRDGTWGSPVIINCYLGLQELAQRPVTESNVDEVASSVQIFTLNPHDLHIHDVIYTTQLLEEVVHVNDNVSEEVGQSVLTSISQLMNVNPYTLLESHVSDNVTNRILNTLETLSHHVTVPDRGSAWTMVEPNLCMQVLDINLTQTFPGHGFLALDLPTEQDGSFLDASIEGVVGSDSVELREVDAAIHIPPDFADYLNRLPDRPQNDIVRLTFTIFQNNRLFQTTVNDSEDTAGFQRTVNSRVVASSVAGLSVRDLAIPIQTSFKPLVSDQYTNNTECVYWDFGLRFGKGGWSTDGCWLNRTEEGRVVCYCDHLTNFAVLMDIYGQGAPLSAADVFALDIISKVGCSLSIAGLSFTLLTAAVFRRFRTSTPQIILIQLSVALLGVLITFLAGIDRVDPSAGCIAVAACLHYFLLAGLMWMAVEAFSMYMAFVKVMSTHISKFVLKVSLVAWGVPLIIVVVTLAVDVDHYNGGDKYCWMALTPLYYAFMLPAGLIILFNLVVFILIVKELYCKRKGSSVTLRKSKKVTGPPPPRHKETLQRFRVAVTIFVVLGLTWVFGFLAISGARTVFAYLFCIFNSLQGFLIFIFFCVRQKEVRDRWFFLCAACFNRQYSFSEVMISRSMESNSNFRTPGSTPAFGRKYTTGVKDPYSHQNGAKLMMNGTSHNGTARSNLNYNSYTYRNKGYKADTISVSSKSTTDGAEELQPDTV